jgi:hypothetical protein
MRRNREEGARPISVGKEVGTERTQRTGHPDCVLVKEQQVVCRLSSTDKVFAIVGQGAMLPYSGRKCLMAFSNSTVLIDFSTKAFAPASSA